MMRSFLAGAAVAVSALLASATPSLADFGVCNKSNETVDIALGYPDRNQWMASGWWNLAPAKCIVLIKGKLTNQYYYIYAVGDQNGEWKGPDEQQGGIFCVSEKAFTFALKEFMVSETEVDCEAKGAQALKFVELDTQNQANYVVNLE